MCGRHDCFTSPRRNTIDFLSTYIALMTGIKSYSNMFHLKPTVL